MKKKIVGKKFGLLNQIKSVELELMFDDKDVKASIVACVL